MSEKTTPTQESMSFKESIAKLESSLEDIFKKAPALPDNIKELIVNVSPWLAVIGVIMLVPMILAVLGIGAIFMPITLIAGATLGFQYMVSMIFAIIMIILQIMALPGLFKRNKQAWQLMFYASLVSIVQNIILFNISALIIGGIISFYILFQVKEKYIN